MIVWMNCCHSNRDTHYCCFVDHYSILSRNSNVLVRCYSLDGFFRKMLDCSRRSVRRRLAVYYSIQVDCSRKILDCPWRSVVHGFVAYCSILGYSRKMVESSRSIRPTIFVHCFFFDSPRSSVLTGRHYAMIPCRWWSCTFVTNWLRSTEVYTKKFKLILSGRYRTQCSFYFLKLMTLWVWMIINNSMEDVYS